MSVFVCSGPPAPTRRDALLIVAQRTTRLLFAFGLLVVSGFCLLIASAISTDPDFLSTESPGHDYSATRQDVFFLASLMALVGVIVGGAALVLGWRGVRRRPAEGVDVVIAGGGALICFLAAMLFF